jgi:NTE family protein
MARKVGLVLSGGGGKGSYQIGVWKALRELGIAQKIKVVAGASVGSLNMALFLQGQLSLAESIWLNLRPTDILKPHAAQSFRPESLSELPAWLRGVLHHLADRGIFSQRGLERIMEKNLRYQDIASSPIKALATCLADWPNGPATYFPLNGCDPTRLKKILLASSAIPYIFDPVEIDGRTYSDGGIGIGSDNIPVRPVHAQRCDLIYVVHLGQNLLDETAFPGSKLIQIVPSKNLGGTLEGTLDFHGEHARWRMELGYRDARVQLMGK